MKKSRKKEVFNENQKNRYLEFDKKYYKEMLRLFKNLAPMEEKLNKDVAKMSPNEYRDTIQALDITWKSTIGQTLSMVARYIDWAFSNGLTDTVLQAETITAETIDNMSAISRKTLENPESLQKMIDVTFTAGATNKKYRDSLLVWLMYFGVTFDEVCNIKKTDVDYERKKVITGLGKEYLLPDDVIYLCHRVSEMDCVEYMSSLRTMKLTDNDYLFRGVLGRQGNTTEPLIAVVARNYVSKIFQNYSEHTGEEYFIPPANIRLSGLFYNVYTLEKGGQVINKEFFQDYLKKIEFDESVTDYSARDYYLNYVDWKAAFKLI